MDTWVAIAKIAAVVVGLVFGSGAISVASIVWLRRQIFAYGGSALCLSGVVLIGSSIWRTVEFDIGPSGIRFQGAQQLAASAAAAAQSADKAVKAAAVAIDLASAGRPAVSYNFATEDKLAEARKQLEVARVASVSALQSSQDALAAVSLKMAPGAR